MAYAPAAVAGTLLKIWRGSPSSFATIRGVEGFQGPTGTKPTIDVTAIDDSAKQFVADLPDYGSVTFDLFWDPDEVTHSDLFAAFGITNSSDNFRIEPSDDSGKFLLFTGEVVGWEWDFSRAQAQRARVSIKLSGAATING